MGDPKVPDNSEERPTAVTISESDMEESSLVSTFGRAIPAEFEAPWAARYQRRRQMAAGYATLPLFRTTNAVATPSLGADADEDVSQTENPTGSSPRPTPPATNPPSSPYPSDSASSSSTSSTSSSSPSTTSPSTANPNGAFHVTEDPDRAPDSNRFQQDNGDPAQTTTSANGNEIRIAPTSPYSSSSSSLSSASSSPSPPPPPSQPPSSAAPSTLKRERGWAPWEEDALIDSVRHVVDHENGRSMGVHDMWEAIMARAANVHGLSRAKDACRMRWNRKLRAKTRFDERKTQNPGSLVTCAQEAKKDGLGKRHRDDDDDEDERGAPKGGRRIAGNGRRLLK